MQRISLYLLLTAAFCIYFFHLSSLMTFFGDAGWYYLDARDLLLGEQFPLVGLPTSHPWLHQGAGWTYLLSLAMTFGSFHPVSGAYLAASIGVLTVFSLYYVGSKLYSFSAGMLSSLLFLTSPLAIVYMRTPFHTTPLPFLSVWVFYLIVKWIEGSRKSFIGLLGLLAVSYQFEIASTIFLGFPVILLFLYGMWKKKVYFTILLSEKGKTIQKGLGLFLLVFSPILLYDLNHGFPQTLRYGVWFIYRLLATFHIIPRLYITPEQPLSDFIYYTHEYIQRIFFYGQKELSLGLSLFLFGSFFLILKQQWMRKERNIRLQLLYFFTLFTSGTYLVYRNASEGFVHIILPFLFLSLGYVFSQLRRKNWGIYAFVGIVIVNNLFYVFSTDYFTVSKGEKRITFSAQEKGVKQLLQYAGDSQVQLKMKNPTIVTLTDTMNYEYLLWYLEKGETKEGIKTYLIEEKNGEVFFEAL